MRGGVRNIILEDTVHLPLKIDISNTHFRDDVSQLTSSTKKELQLDLDDDLVHMHDTWHRGSGYTFECLICHSSLVLAESKSELEDLSKESFSFCR